MYYAPDVEPECDPYRREGGYEYLSVILDLWCAGKSYPTCHESKRLAIFYACEKGELEYERTGRGYKMGWGDSAEEINSNKNCALLIHRESFNKWMQMKGFPEGKDGNFLPTSFSQRESVLPPQKPHMFSYNFANPSETVSYQMTPQQQAEVAPWMNQKTPYQQPALPAPNVSSTQPLIPPPVMPVATTPMARKSTMQAMAFAEFLAHVVTHGGYIPEQLPFNAVTLVDVFNNTVDQKYHVTVSDVPGFVHRNRPLLCGKVGSTHIAFSKDTQTRDIMVEIKILLRINPFKLIS